jgi:exodeoxyribonuclease VIII
MSTAQNPYPAGVIAGMSSADYFALSDVLSSTGARKLSRSPLHFFGTTLDPQRPPQQPSDAMLAGTLAHCALLEPDCLSSRYAIVPASAPRRPSVIQRNAKKPSPESIYAIEWWDTFAAEHAGAEIIDAEQLKTAHHQAASISKLPEIGPLLSAGEPELSAFWTDRATGVRCKCRPDWTSYGPGSAVLLDLKTTQDASEKAFSRSIWNYRYDMQAAWYTDGYEQASGTMCMGFVFICVESDWPHAAAAYMIDDEFMAGARADNRRAIELYSECKRTNEWPGYSSAIQVLSRPAWARFA